MPFAVIAVLVIEICSGQVGKLSHALMCLSSPFYDS